MSDAVELLASLEAAGVRVTLNATGDGLKVKANSQPPAELLAQIQAARPALLEALGVILSDRTLREVTMPGRSMISTLPAANILPHTCSTCTRWEALPTPLAHMGLCGAGRGAHGWQDGNPSSPVEIQGGCTCLAHGGYKAKMLLTE